MIVYLMRHGQAGGGPDAERELTGTGARESEAVARRARAAGARPALALSSTYARARQTAEIVARVLECARPVERTEALLPNGPALAAWEEIRARQAAGDILVAGHQPLMGELAALLLDAPSLEVQMTPAAMLAIEVEHADPRPSGILLWMVTPRVA